MPSNSPLQNKEPDLQINKQRQSLRNTFRQQRRALSASSQIQHAAGLKQQLGHKLMIRRSNKIATYLAADGEIDPLLLTHHLWALNKKVYLPILAPFSQRLYFAPYTPGCKMKLNHFNIAEPDTPAKFWLQARQLDLILMPLVGFDASGNRLGMGGGFYDRSLNFTRFARNKHRPCLIGLAHQIQQTQSLPHQPHDIPLHFIATEKRLISCQ